MLEDLFGGLFDPVGPVDDELFLFSEPENPLLYRYKNRVEMPVDMHIGLTLMGEHGRAQFFERMRMLRIKNRME